MNLSLQLHWSQGRFDQGGVLWNDICSQQTPLHGDLILSVWMIRIRISIAVNLITKGSIHWWTVVSWRPPVNVYNFLYRSMKRPFSQSFVQFTFHFISAAKAEDPCAWWFSGLSAPAGAPAGLRWLELCSLDVPPLPDARHPPLPNAWIR